LPTRDWRTKSHVLAKTVTKKYQTPAGNMILNPVQAASLVEAKTCGGLLCCAGVGWGKTLISFLIPKVINAKKPVLIVPANLKRSTVLLYLQYKKHWQLPKLTIGKYSTLSNFKENLLTRMEPDCLIFDEVHKIKNLKASRTKCVLKYLKKHPYTKIYGLSGTITKDSLFDYWHLLKWILKDGSPLPFDWPEANLWDLAISTKADNYFFQKVDPGPIMNWSDKPTNKKFIFANRKKIGRQGYRNRLKSTPGVIITENQSCSSSIIFNDQKIDFSSKMRKIYKECEETWINPDNNELCSPLELYNLLRQLSFGFYLKWKDSPPQKWKLARANWISERKDLLRYKRKYRSFGHIENDCEKGIINSQNYEIWKKVEKTFKPKTIAVWLDKSILRKFITPKKPTLIWYHHICIADILAEKYQIYPSTTNPDKLDKAYTIALSMSHIIGKNLQLWSNNLVLDLPSSGVTWEQLIGRTHRQGQFDDEINFWIPRHTPILRKSFDHAIIEAEYQQDTTEQKHKLLAARFNW
jgi:hypothetical protein